MHFSFKPVPSVCSARGSFGVRSTTPSTASKSQSQLRSFWPVLLSRIRRQANLWKMPGQADDALLPRTPPGANNHRTHHVAKRTRTSRCHAYSFTRTRRRACTRTTHAHTHNRYRVEARPNVVTHRHVAQRSSSMGSLCVRCVSRDENESRCLWSRSVRVSAFQKPNLKSPRAFVS